MPWGPAKPIDLKAFAAYHCRMPLRDKTAQNEYMRQYVLARHHRRMAAGIALLGGKCVRCGATERLEFSHLDPATKSFVIAKRAVGVSEAKLQAELQKCQLLCHDCSTEKGILDRGQLPRGDRHGTLTMYKHCKCDLCRAVMSAWNRNYIRTARKLRPRPPMTEAQRATMRKRRDTMEQWIRDLKETVSCSDCGRRFPHFVMDFDHVRGEKTEGVASLRRRMKWSQIRSEIEKCDIVCANCHRVRTHPHPHSSKAEGVAVLKRVIVDGLIKAFSPCEDCHEFFPLSAMDFDHVRGEKEHEISTLVKNRMPLIKLLVELEKCDLVCTNCHRIRTYGKFYPDDVTRWRSATSVATSKIRGGIGAV